VGPRASQDTMMNRKISALVRNQILAIVPIHNHYTVIYNPFITDIIKFSVQ